MISYKNNNFVSSESCVVALGCFDGVHLGHKAVISEAVRIAGDLSVKSAVWTFDAPPRNFFNPSASPIITDRDEKRRLMRSLGIDIFVSVPFDLAVSALSACEFFVDILLGKLNAVHIVCGFNYSFGKNGEGNAKLLEELCREHGVGLSCISPIDIDGTPVSSSVIRSAVENGDMDTVQKYLGRPYAINTLVINGQKLGRRLGFPTINQVFKEGILVPRNGVYITRVSISSKKYFGITNVGVRPTVGGKVLCAETHILNFSGDLYGQKLRVEFLRFMRPETKFSSVEELSEKVHLDIEEARKIIAQKVL